MESSTQNRSSADLQHQSKVVGIILELAQYPILARRIRERMRQELFYKRIIAPEVFEAQVKKNAITSQEREGMSDPFSEEPMGVWHERLALVRDQLTDFYFAYNVPHDRLEEIIHSVLVSRGAPAGHDMMLGFNPELSPWDLLFAKGDEFERLPPEKRVRIRHHLQEIIVVLIKGMISDQLELVGVAKELFTIQDLKEIRRRRIGRGKVGGKAAGMLLACKILQLSHEKDAMDVHEYVEIPDSYYIGADVFYDFISANGFNRYMNQKYKRPEEMADDYPQIRAAYMDGHFPDDIVYSLGQLLEKMGDAPLIVRSSSLLEDNFGTAFAGKYDSFFCPNQGTLEDNLAALMNAIKKVYASVLNPAALLYRQHMGLVDYDERMAVLIQKVKGTRYRDYFFPALAGVGYSRNPFRWNPKIRREDGFLRLVYGLGTRAVDRVANDYPRMIALSHPHLRPEVGAQKIRKYSQHFVDLVDLKDDLFKTLPVRDVIADDYPALRYLVSVDKGGYLAPPISRMDMSDAGDLVLTFEQLLQDKQFVTLMKTILAKLERHYKWPVDIEFTVDVQPDYPNAAYTVNLLQCRPLVSQEWTGEVEIPEGILEQDLILKACKLVPQGVVSDVRYIVYVDPAEYNHVPDYVTKLELARVVGRLNKRLEGERFILMGPGRWGSSSLDLGVKVTYADIYNTLVLVEIPLVREGSTAEASHGTHFFQDLVEAGIFPLPVIPEEGAMLNTEFLTESSNELVKLLPSDAAYGRYIRVIDVPAVTGGRNLEIVMDGENELAVGYLKRDE
ncbi:MAG: phosphoenolpyruvate synthase [Chloroflexi bacterium]|nr:phosphoenolpyruvate synthase [Chloroflexota bacterium]